MKDHPSIEPGSLAEHLYSHHSVKDLEQLVAIGSFELIKRRWSLSTEQCQQQVELAMHYIRQD